MRISDWSSDVCSSDLDHEASDALQDTFITAGERLHQLRDPSRFRPWVYAIARRRAYLVTSRQRRFETLEDDDVISAEPDYSEGLAAAELRALIEGAAGGLDDKDRLLLDLPVRHELGRESCRERGCQ